MGKDWSRMILLQIFICARDEELSFLRCEAPAAERSRGLPARLAGDDRGPQVPADASGLRGETEGVAATRESSALSRRHFCGRVAGILQSDSQVTADAGGLQSDAAGAGIPVYPQDSPEHSFGCTPA